MGQWVTISEAADRLGRSERTIRRWVNADKIPVDRTTPVILVDIGDVIETELDKTDTDSLAAEVERLATEAERLEAEVGHLQTQIDHLQTLLDEVTGDRNYLRLALSESMTQAGRLLAEPRRKQWWQFWKTDEEE